jgi:hypothetical protein
LNNFLCDIQHKPIVASTDFLKSGRRFSLATSIQNQFRFTSHRVNFILKYLDPKQYEALLRLRQAVHLKYPFASALNHIDPLLQEGRAIMWNRRTANHADSTDPVTAWVTLIVLGEFTKGDLYIKRLNLRLFYEPGTIIIIRGHILPHEVEIWEGGQRVSIVHFTHESFGRNLE